MIKMSYTLSPYEVVRVNCEMFRGTNEDIESSWNSPSNRIALHGFLAESVKDVDLKRLFLTNFLSYMFINIQQLLGIFISDIQLDNETFIDGVFLTRQSNTGRRRFKIIRHFRIYDHVSCRPTSHYITVTAKVNEDPGPWVVSIVIDMCKVENGVEYLINSDNRFPKS
jgi:hypothetical protein